MMEVGNPYIQYMYSYPHKTAYGPLEGVFLEDYVGMMAGKGHGRSEERRVGKECGLGV